MRARDIILSKNDPGLTSANNVLPCTVVDLREDPGAFVDVQLDCGGTRFLARITKRSLERMKLEPGQAVHALAKSVTLDRRAMNRRLGKGSG